MTAWFLFFVIIRGCLGDMKMHETIERVVMVHRTGSDLQPAATGYRYEQQGEEPARVTQLNEHDVIKHFESMPTQYNQHSIPLSSALHTKVEPEIEKKETDTDSLKHNKKSEEYVTNESLKDKNQNDFLEDVKSKYSENGDTRKSEIFQLGSHYNKGAKLDQPKSGDDALLYGSSQNKDFSSRGTSGRATEDTAEGFIQKEQDQKDGQFLRASHADSSLDQHEPFGSFDKYRYQDDIHRYQSLGANLDSGIGSNKYGGFAPVDRYGEDWSTSGGLGYDHYSPEPFTFWDAKNSADQFYKRSISDSRHPYEFGYDVNH